MPNAYLRCGFISTHCSEVSNALIGFSMTLTHLTVDGRPKGAPPTTVLRLPSTSWPVRKFFVLIEQFPYLTVVHPLKVIIFNTLWLHRSVYRLLSFLGALIERSNILNIGSLPKTSRYTGVCHFLISADVLLYWYVPFSQILACAIFLNLQTSCYTSMCHFLKSADVLLYWYVPFSQILACVIFLNLQTSCYIGMCRFLKSANVLLYWHVPLS